MIMRLLLHFFVCFCFIINPSMAQTEKSSEPSPNIMIHEAYAFATMPGGETGAAFMTIMNHGGIDDALIGAKSNLAKHTEIHENLIDPDDGTMMMRKIKKIDIPAKEHAVLEPKGYHIMFMKLKQPFTLDSQFPLTLIFEKSGEKQINVVVIQPGTKLSSDTIETTTHDHSHDHLHDNMAQEKEIEEGFPENSFSQESNGL